MPPTLPRQSQIENQALLDKWAPTRGEYFTTRDSDRALCARLENKRFVLHRRLSELRIAIRSEDDGDENQCRLVDEVLFNAV
ncbi:hypothetical protein T265_04452 [Opisthorchis viverrini]|uniref:Uncharacterized protein n=1 Tax=Opisthorchis viverrini TaxID=6198 RepID=A0A074ZNT2_OPIVI|nr:hypothetical protein T265_04452 [Opisthorchis viverrini]KER28761.1 hypothetical protein T265_04452 [Opisthorchis viverrini]